MVCKRFIGVIKGIYNDLMNAEPEVPGAVKVPVEGQQPQKEVPLREKKEL